MLGVDVSLLVFLLLAVVGMLLERLARVKRPQP